MNIHNDIALGEGQYIEFKESLDKNFAKEVVAFVNASGGIIHLGDSIAVEKLKNSIVINNKGELLFPERDFGKRSESRNRLLADLLSRTNYMEKAGTGIKRVKDACQANNNACNYRFTDAFWIEMISNEKNNVEDNINNVGVNEGVNVGVNVGVNKILELIQNNPGINTNELLLHFDVTKRTIERWMRELREMKKIEFRGVPKTGGYYAVENDVKTKKIVKIVQTCIEII